MEIKSFKIWENTRGDGVQEENDSSYTEKSSTSIIISVPSGEVITVYNQNDLKELSHKKLITYYKVYKNYPLSNYCCNDEDASKVKYLIDSSKPKKSDYIPIAKEYRENLWKVTGKYYVITYDKKIREFVAIIPDLNLVGSIFLSNLENVCIKMENEHPNYSFQYRNRNIQLYGIEYLKLED